MTPKRQNVEFFASAAVAEIAGFRPCLRCRPETAPGRGIWNGTRTTVDRALAMIDNGALDDGSVDELAERLGVGDRHLRRLFREQLGVSPLRVARCRRVRFAKQLLDQTNLPVSRIAFDSGFSSLRRFNAAMVEAYGLAPSRLRTRRHKASVKKQDAVTLRLSTRPPFDWPQVRDFLALRAIEGVERVESNRYCRGVEYDGEVGVVEIQPVDECSVTVSVPTKFSAHLFDIVRRVRKVLDLDADPGAIRERLGPDPVLGALVIQRPGLRVPEAWSGFEALVRAIVGQQVTLAHSLKLISHWLTAFELPGDAGGLVAFPSAPRFVAGLTSIEDLPGMPRNRFAALAESACVVSNGEVDLEFPFGDEGRD